MEHDSLLERVSSRVRDIRLALGTVHTDKQVLCCVCQTRCKGLTPASHVCLACGDTLCNTCLQWHNSSSITHAHRTVVVADVMNGTFKVDVQRKVRCDSHRNWYLEFHCLSCSENACALDLYKHMGHDFNDLDHVAKTCRARMMEMSQSIQDRITDPVTAVLDRVKQHTDHKVEVTQIVDKIDSLLTERKLDAAVCTTDTSTSAWALVKSASLVLSAVEEASLSSNATLLNVYPDIRKCMELAMNSVHNDEQLATALKKLRADLSTDEPLECVANTVQSLGRWVLNPTLPSVIVDNTTEIRTRTLAEEIPGEEAHANTTLETPEDDISTLASVLSERDTMDPRSDQSKSTHEQCKGNGARKKESGVFAEHEKKTNKLQSIASPNPDKTTKARSKKSGVLAEHEKKTNDCQSIASPNPDKTAKARSKKSGVLNEHEKKTNDCQCIASPNPDETTKARSKKSGVLAEHEKKTNESQSMASPYPDKTAKAHDSKTSIFKEDLAVMRHLGGNTTEIQASRSPKQMLKGTKSKNTNKMSRQSTESIPMKTPHGFRLSACLTLVTECGLDPSIVDCSYEYVKDPNLCWVADAVPSGILADVFLMPESYTKKATSGISTAVHGSSGNSHSPDTASSKEEDSSGQERSSSAIKQRENQLSKSVHQNTPSKHTLQDGMPKQFWHDGATASQRPSKQVLEMKHVCDKATASQNGAMQVGASNQSHDEITASENAAKKSRLSKQLCDKPTVKTNTAKEDGVSKQLCNKATASQHAAKQYRSPKQLCDKATANENSEKQVGASNQSHIETTASAAKHDLSPNKLCDKITESPDTAKPLRTSKQSHDKTTASQNAAKQGPALKHASDKTTVSHYAAKQVGTSKQSNDESTASENTAKHGLPPKQLCYKTTESESAAKKDGMMSKQLSDETSARRKAMKRMKKKKKKQMMKIKMKQLSDATNTCPGQTHKHIRDNTTANTNAAKQDGTPKQLCDNTTANINAATQLGTPKQLHKTTTSGLCTVDNMEQKAHARPDDTEFNTSTHKEVSVKHIGTCNAQLKHVGSIKLATSQDEDNPHVVGMCICRGNRIVFLDDANLRVREIDVIGRHGSTHRPPVLCTAFCNHSVLCCGNKIVYLSGNYVHIANAVLELRSIIMIEQNPSGTSTSLAPLVLCNYNKLSFLVANLPDNMYRVYNTDGNVEKSGRFPVRYPIVAMSLSVDEESILASSSNHFGAVHRVNQGTHVTMTFRPPDVTQWYPESTCSDRKNNVYVACPQQHKIYIFLPSGDLWFVHSTSRDDPALLPCCLIMSRDDTLFVSRQPPKLYKYVLHS